MGIFDSVYAPCAHCGAPIEYQSKADPDPYMHNYTVEDAPAHIINDVLNEPHFCVKCEKWTVLYDPAFPPNPPPNPPPRPRSHPTPRAVRQAKEGEYTSHFQGWRWWEAPFTEDDLV